MIAGRQVNVVIPALNEEYALPGVLGAIDKDLVDNIIVADNGSSDNTADVARAAGALVVFESRRGYGSACLKAIAEGPHCDILVFLDGDGGDDPADIKLLLETLVNGDLDLVIGSRTMGSAEAGALTSVQRIGNKLTCLLVRWFWGVRYTDLGPLRAVSRCAYDSMEMCDPDYGWTIEMQVKAAQQGLRVNEVPVSYSNRQAGQSKVSGTVIGSFKAGKRILGYVFAAKGLEIRHMFKNKPKSNRETGRS